MNHQAIFKAYPNVVTFDDEAGAVDAAGNMIEIDEAKVKAAEVILLNEFEKNEKTRLELRAALLERLGITEDEAKLLLG